MRAFDWKSLLDRERIEYIDRGANVKRSEINIKCPWCGAADPSFHLGLNLDSGYYSCWRNKSGHSGKSPLRLLMKLLRVSYEQARTLAGFGDDYLDPEGFDLLAARLMGREIVGNATEVALKRSTFLNLPEYEFEPVERYGSTRRWWSYLYSRFFDDAHIPKLCEKYDLHAGVRGEYASRLILPYHVGGKVTAWTGRAIGAAAIRYKDLPRDECIIPIKDSLYLYDEAVGGGAALVIVEGPLDALKLDFFGANYGVHAVALSTNSVSEQQRYLLEELAPEFDRVFVMMDAKTDFGAVDSMRMSSQLSIPDLGILKVPFQRSDAGELRPNEAEWFTVNLARNVTEEAT